MSDTAKEDATLRPTSEADGVHLESGGPGSQPNGWSNGRGSSQQTASIQVEADVQQELDHLSLRQALMDTEAATARVIDLTERLVEARGQLVELRDELEHLRIEHEQYRAEQERVQSSSAFRLAKRIWAVRNALNI